MAALFVGEEHLEIDGFDPQCLTLCLFGAWVLKPFFCGFSHDREVYQLSKTEFRDWIFHIMWNYWFRVA